MQDSIKAQIVYEFNYAIADIEDTISIVSDPLLSRRLKMKKVVLEDVKNTIMSMKSDINKQFITRTYHIASVSMTEGDIGHNSGMDHAMKILSRYM